MDRRTDQRTDGQTDMTTYRAAIAAKNPTKSPAHNKKNRPHFCLWQAECMRYGKVITPFGERDISSTLHVTTYMAKTTMFVEELTQMWWVPDISISNDHRYSCPLT